MQRFLFNPLALGRELSAVERLPVEITAENIEDAMEEVRGLGRGHAWEVWVPRDTSPPYPTARALLGLAEDISG